MDRFSSFISSNDVFELIIEFESSDGADLDVHFRWLIVEDFVDIFPRLSVDYLIRIFGFSTKSVDFSDSLHKRKSFNDFSNRSIVSRNSDSFCRNHYPNVLIVFLIVQFHLDFYHIRFNNKIIKIHYSQPPIINTINKFTLNGNCLGICSKADKTSTAIFF
ncbi:hypothetical protein DERP_015446 [Dermatophagoides pteronyssinus]|uniref:Uncharacterized protein n=1 Tax=Dermatophagoides pteronyssinus TaxID=6956 RepID=A0ABQ8JFH4_DERPT|nr:hypothetical protein DERP_015446 [Dermatophagoides pteronyssinus]